MDDKITIVNIDDLIIGAKGFDVRGLDEETVERYQEVAEELPPIDVWFDPETDDLYLVDGRHRCEAREREGYTYVYARILECDRIEAEVRAFSANLTHPLPLTEVQRRRAIEEVVLRRYERSNNWISEEAGCSPTTIRRARERLEEDGKIPVLDRLERKGGGTTPRVYSTISSDDDNASRNEPDFFDEAEEREKAKKEQEKEVKPPDNLLADDGTPTDDGGYDVEEDDQGDEDGAEGGPITTGLEAAVAAELPQQLRDHALQFAQMGQALPAEVTLYVDGQAHSIPVTLMFAAGTISGVPDSSLLENQRAALVLDSQVAKKLRLLY